MLNLLFSLVFQIPAFRFIVLAVGPALLLLHKVRGKDKLEPEPPKLIWSLVGLGVLSTVIAMAVELGLLTVLKGLIGETGFLFRFLQMVVIVGLTEEACKYLMLRLRTWEEREFNCLFDGMVYAVAVSAGFALAENILYGLRGGMAVLLMRAVVSIPAHICFSVFMGLWYGTAKRCAVDGDLKKARRNQLLAVFVPAAAHGLFDLLAQYADSTALLMVFIVYVAAMFFLCWRLVGSFAEKDMYFVSPPAGNSPAQDERVSPGP